MSESEILSVLREFLWGAVQISMPILAAALIVGYQTIGYQIILMLVCFLLCAMAAGRWAGIDFFFRKLHINGDIEAGFIWGDRTLEQPGKFVRGECLHSLTAGGFQDAAIG